MASYGGKEGITRDPLKERNRKGKEKREKKGKNRDELNVKFRGF